MAANTENYKVDTKSVLILEATDSANGSFTITALVNFDSQSDVINFQITKSCTLQK